MIYTNQQFDVSFKPHEEIGIITVIAYREMKINYIDFKLLSNRPADMALWLAI